MSFKWWLKRGLVLGGILLVTTGSVWLASRFIARGNGPATDVDVVAHQWWWEFDYPRQGVKVANVLHLPEDRSARLMLTSADVLHSFWLPSMRLSVDVVPGQKRTLMLNLQNIGTLNGSCGAGCGCDTVCMRFRVLITNNQEFQQWIKKQRGVPLKQGNTIAPTCVFSRSVDGARSSFASRKPSTRVARKNGAAGPAPSPVSAP